MRFLKNIERSTPYRRLKWRIKGYLGLEPLVTVEKDNNLEIVGDWAFLKEWINEDSVVYSFGVGDDIAFDLAISQAADCQVFCFDPTIDGSIFELEGSNEKRINFYPWAVAGIDGELALYDRLNSSGVSSGMFTLARASADGENLIKAPAFTVKTIMQKLGHTRVDLIKLDVEGAEFEALGSMLDNQIRPRQLLIEFHHRFKDFSVIQVKESLKRLRKLGYHVAYVTPSGREFTFLLYPD